MTQYSTGEIQLPYPEYSETATGPDAIQALAQATADKMPTFRWNESNFNQNGFTALPGGPPVDAHSLTSYPLVVVGWADLLFNITLNSVQYGTPQQLNANFAGFLYLYVNGTQIGAPERFHSLGSPGARVGIHRHAPLFKATSVFQVQVKLTIDGLSSAAVTVLIDQWNITQFGTLRS